VPFRSAVSAHLADVEHSNSQYVTPKRLDKYFDDERANKGKSGEKSIDIYRLIHRDRGSGASFGAGVVVAPPVEMGSLAMMPLVEFATKAKAKLAGGHWITVDTASGYRHLYIEGPKGRPTGRVLAGAGATPDAPKTLAEVVGAKDDRSAGKAVEEKSKFVGETVGKAEHVHAAEQERRVARAVGGKVLDDNEPLDVRVEVPGGGEHAIEVKSLMKGRKKSISVHDDALLRKVTYAEANPASTYHTVVVDRRAKYASGAHAENFSGHEIYYRRGSGRYSLSTMHKVKDEAELKALIHARAVDLPAKARGSLPSGEAKAGLAAKAEKAHAARLAKDRARKARIKEAGAQA